MQVHCAHALSYPRPIISNANPCLICMALSCTWIFHRCSRYQIGAAIIFVLTRDSFLRRRQKGSAHQPWMRFIIFSAVENIAKAGGLLHDCSTFAQEVLTFASVSGEGGGYFCMIAKLLLKKCTTFASVLLHFSAAVRLRLFLPFKIGNIHA